MPWIQYAPGEWVDMVTMETRSSPYNPDEPPPAPTGADVPVSYVVPAAPELGAFTSKAEAEAAVPGAQVVSSGFVDGGIGSQNATTWVSLSGSAPGPNGAPPADATVAPWERQGEQGGGLFGSDSALSSTPFRLATLAAGAFGSGLLTPDTVTGAIPGSSGQLLAANTAGVSDTPTLDELMARASAGNASGTDPLAVNWDQPFTSGTGVGAVAPGTNYTGLIVPAAGAAGSGALASGAASGAGAAAAGSAIKTSNDTPGETSVAPGVVGPGSAPGYGVGSSVANGAATAATSSAISRIIDGTASTADWASVLGTGAATGLGVYGATQQANSLRDIADQARADRAPFLAKANQYLAGGPEAFAAGDGAGALKGVLAQLAAKNGNPIDSPTSLGIATDAAYRNWLNGATTFGNIGLAGQDSRSNLLASAAGADANGLNAIGYGLGQVTQPQTSLSDLLKRLGGNQNAFSLT